MSNSAINFVPKRSHLDFWIQNKLNVLFIGKHGVGKTSLILDAFQGNNLRYKYFSASTMDPWVDFIGVPRSMEDANGPYLDLVRPKDFRDDEIEALFFDEFNRSHKKVRNAVMELIQFKSINGRVFKNLKIIWAAVNPDDDDSATYDVETLDPAQKDRFHVHIGIPYEPHFPYFEGKYGVDVATDVIDWWKGLDTAMQNEVSPRRLDYAVQYVKSGGDARHVLPPKSNVGAFLHMFSNGSPLRKLQDLLSVSPHVDLVALKSFLENTNNYNACKVKICREPAIRNVCLPLLSQETFAALLGEKNKAILKEVMRNPTPYESVLRVLETSTSNKEISLLAKKALTRLRKTTTPQVAANSLEAAVANNSSTRSTLKYYRDILSHIKWATSYPPLSLSLVSMTGSERDNARADFVNSVGTLKLKTSTTYNRQWLAVTLLRNWVAPVEVVQAQLCVLDGLVSRMHQKSVDSIFVGPNPPGKAKAATLSPQDILERLLWLLHKNGDQVSPFFVPRSVANTAKCSDLGILDLYEIVPSLMEKAIVPLFVVNRLSSIFAR